MAAPTMGVTRFERGTIRGVDVSGLSFVNVCHIPGNVLAPGSWRVVSLVDDRASDEQFRAILDAYHGRLGWPLADLAGLVGEVVAVERARSSTRPGRAAAGCVWARPCRPTWSRSVAPTAPSRPCGTRCSRPSPARRRTWPGPTTTRVELARHGMAWSFEGRTATGVADRFHHDALLGGGPPGQGRRGRLLACLTAGYLAGWALFGWAALVLDGGVHGTVDAVGWLAARPWLVGAADLAGWRPWPG